MFVSRREWEDMCQTKRALIRNNEEKEQIINDLKLQLENSALQNIKLSEQISHHENVNKIQRDSIDVYRKDNDTLIKANQKLIDWINKIINEVGIYEVHDRRTITIPIYKSSAKAVFGSINDIKASMENFVNQEEIIIPEIRFIKMK